MLEAIGLSSSLRSFRRTGMDGIIKEGETECRLFFRFQGDSGQESEVLLGFSQGEKTVEVDGEPIKKIGDFWVIFPQYVSHQEIFVWFGRVPVIEGNG